MKDIQAYSEKYLIPGFEEYKVIYRRKKILEIIEQYRPKNILEIGCGTEPLFQYVENTDFTIVEAAQDFYQNAVDMSKDKAGSIKVIKGFFEEIASALSEHYDMVICASLLHEVEYPKKLLKAIAYVCDKDTIVNVIVPNANSIHRILGKEMGILDDVHDKSENNITLEQNIVFDKNILKAMLVECGYEIIDEGGFFVKPFSHEQMYKMIQARIINEKVLNGLYSLGEYMVDFASELYVNCKFKMA